MIPKLHYISQGNSLKEHHDNIQKACATGIELVLLDVHNYSDKKLLKLATEVRETTAHYQTRLIIEEETLDLPSFAPSGLSPGGPPPGGGGGKAGGRGAPEGRKASWVPSKMHSWQEASAGANNGGSRKNMQILRYTVPKRSQLLTPGSVQTNSFSSSSNTELFQSISFSDCAGWTKIVHPKQTPSNIQRSQKIHRSPKPLVPLYAPPTSYYLPLA